MGVRGLLAFALLGLCACASSAPAPAPPAYLTDAPAEVRNGLPVNFSQAKAGDAVPPDPLLTSDGHHVSRAGWPRRRAEIIDLLTANQYGAQPMRLPALRVQADREPSLAPNGARRRQVKLEFAGEDGAARTIDVLIYLPAAASKPAPLVLFVGFSPNAVMVDDPAVVATDAWDAEHKRIPGRQARAIAKPDIAPFLARGYGVALVYYGQIEPDFDGGRPLGVRALYPASQGWGGVAAWSWGLSRVMDYFEQDPDVDARRVAIHGVSRLGKTVLWAGASDPRFAAVIASCSGEGGAALSRRTYGETIGQVAKAFPYWFNARWNGFASDPAQSPVDANLVLAAIAPRPLMLITASQDNWSDPYGEYLAARSASPVWTLLGAKGLGAGIYPPLDHLVGGDLAFVTHTGPHGPAPGDTGMILDFLDAHMKAR
jgi:hypothetical protein